MSWDRLAAAALRVEMARRGVKCGELVRLLSAKGHVVTVQSVRSKLSRGTFSAAFLLQALDAMGCQQLDVPSRDLPASGADSRAS